MLNIRFDGDSDSSDAGPRDIDMGDRYPVGSGGDG